MKKFVLLTSILLPLSLMGCKSLNFDKAEEQRKQELCTEIDTRNQPHCSGSTGG